MDIIQEWTQKYDGDLQKAYQALKDELEQYAERSGGTALLDERGEELDALIRMEEMLEIKE